MIKVHTSNSASSHPFFDRAMKLLSTFFVWVGAVNFQNSKFATHNQRTKEEDPHSFYVKIIHHQQLAYTSSAIARRLFFLFIFKKEKEKRQQSIDVVSVKQYIFQHKANSNNVVCHTLSILISA
jgi:hypothetical protein